MDPEPAKGDPHTHLWSAERVEALSRNLVVPEIDSPKWAGISPQDADNLSFACTAQLLTEYLNCLNFGVSASTIKAWHNHSYQGETSEDGMPNGHGTVQLFGGLAYTGAFTGGLLHGEGTLHWGDGLLSYTGEFFYNSIHGRGTYQWPGRASYTGQVFEGLPHGGGCMYTGEDDFCSYEGFWQHGLRHGQGKLVYGKEGKYVYEGHWDKDRKNGEGHMTYGSGSKYNGHWLEGKRHGKGHLVLMTPQTYTKNTVASLGRLDSTRVHIYEGDWISDLPHGMGQSLWAWGENEAATNHLLNKYIGEYNKGTRHGQGAFYYASGAMYKIVEHGLGLAQLDILLLATSSSWDTTSEVHSPKRQLIFREFVEYLVKIAQRKIKSESTVDLKQPFTLKQ